jgi:acyl-CoA synthetase (NDP forming)
MGYLLVEQMLAHGYAGEVVLVNPAGGEAHGLPMQESSAAAGADIAVIVVPPASVAGVVKECGTLGIPLAAVLSAGFAESGDASAQSDLLRAAVAADVRLMGPNCLGLFGAKASLNLTTLPDLPIGNVALISQSGGLASHVGRRLRQLNDGFGAILTLGNKLDVNITDCLGAIAEETAGMSVLLYLERFDEGDPLLEAIARVRAAVPITVVLGGRSAAGQHAAMSHTASMFGSWSRIAALLRDAGAHVCDRLETAVAASSGTATLLRGRRVFVLCDGGGHSVLLGDACDAVSLELPAPSQALADAISTATKTRFAVSIGNPLDLAGAADTDPSTYAEIASSVATSGEFDACLVGGIFGGYADLFGATVSQIEIATARALSRLSAAGELPIVVQTTYGAENTPALAALREQDIAVLEWPSEAAEWLAARSPGVATGPVGTDVAPTPAPLGLGKNLDRVRRVCVSVGMVDGVGPVTSRQALDDFTDADSWVLRLDDVAHKSRVGAVRVGVATANVRDEFDELVEMAHQLGVGPRIRVAPYIAHDHEILLTLWKGDLNGAGLAIGGGGSQVETARDVAIGRLPRSSSDVDHLLRRTITGSRVLDEFPDSVVDLLRSIILQLVTALDGELRDFEEIEFNPLAVGDFGVALLDALPAPRTPRPLTSKIAE